MKSSLWRQGVEQQVLVASVSLAQKTLHAVTVDGVAELAFRHTEQHLHGRLVLTAVDGAENHAYRENRDGPAAADKERIYVAAQT